MHRGRAMEVCSWIVGAGLAAARLKPDPHTGLHDREGAMASEVLSFVYTRPAELWTRSVTLSLATRSDMWSMSGRSHVFLDDILFSVASLRQFSYSADTCRSIQVRVLLVLQWSTRWQLV